MELYIDNYVQYTAGILFFLFHLQYNRVLTVTQEWTEILFMEVSDEYGIEEWNTQHSLSPSFIAQVIITTAVEMA